MSTHFRLTRTSSDLRLLAAPLSPPSPILTPDDVEATSSSGDIPLLLSLPANDYSGARSSPWAPHPPELDIDVFEGGLCDSASLQTIDTVGTFGPIKRSPVHTGNSSPLMQKVYASSIHNANESIIDEVFFTPQGSVSSLSLSSGFTPPSPHNASPGRRSLHARSYAVSGSPSHKSESRAILGSTNKRARSVHAAQLFADPSSPPSGSPKHTVLYPDLKENEVQCLGSSQTYSTLPTPCFAPPSPSPSVDLITPLTATRAGWHRRPLERTGAIHQRGSGGRSTFPERSPQPPSHSPDHSETSPVLSTSPRLWQLSDSSSMVSIRSHPSISRTNSQTSEDALPYSKFAFLPKNLAWLKDVTIELWIDQEGFRASKPTLRLVGYSPRARSLHPYGTIHASGTDLSAGVAEFMPVKRETFVFHHAILDGPPTLRRVTVGSDESRDYISRHATLNVKTNGVYTVLGTETTSLLIAGGNTRNRAGSRIDHVKLQWKFDYLVNDRRVDASGRTLGGEKTLTPLTFSCSPLLLHPLQGKKIGLMHVVKKSVAAKLAAEKLEPPRCPRARDIQLHPGYQTLNPRRMGTHSRSRSDAQAKDRVPPLEGPAPSSPLGPGDRGRAFDSAKQMQYTRRRRASSAGENGWAINSALSKGGGLQSTLPRATISKHIMPNSELSEMITSDVPLEPNQLHPGLVALSPPRYRFPLVVRAGG